MLHTCVRRFALHQRLTQLRTELSKGLSHGGLYALTDDFFADPSVMTDDPRVIVSHAHTLVQLQAKFGHHCKQLFTGIIQPLALRTAMLPDLQLKDALSLVRLSLDLPALAEPKLVKETLRTVIRDVQLAKEPLDRHTVENLYQIQRLSRVVSYELVAELETHLLSAHRGLLSLNHALNLPQVYAYLGLNIDRIRSALSTVILQEAPTASDAAFISLLKSLVISEEFPALLWQDTLFPRLQKMKIHHLNKDLLEDLGLVVLGVDLLAKDLPFRSTEAYKQMSKEALAAYRAKLVASPANALVDDLVKALREAKEEFTQNHITPKPYSLLAELFQAPTTVIKPLTRTDLLHDSFQPLGLTRFQIHLLRKLGYQVIEVNWREWTQIPRKKAPGQLIRLLRLAQDKASRS